MRPGSVRALVLPSGAPVPVVDAPSGALRVEREVVRAGEGAVQRYRVAALAVGAATIRVGGDEWRIEVRGAPQSVEQTRDDTDAGWGDAGRAHSRSWWEEQRPPHW